MISTSFYLLFIQEKSKTNKHTLHSQHLYAAVDKMVEIFDPPNFFTREQGRFYSRMRGTPTLSNPTHIEPFSPVTDISEVKCSNFSSPSVDNPTFTNHYYICSINSCRQNTNCSPGVRLSCQVRRGPEVM